MLALGCFFAVIYLATGVTFAVLGIHGKPWLVALLIWSVLIGLPSLVALRKGMYLPSWNDRIEDYRRDRDGE